MVLVLLDLAFSFSLINEKGFYDILSNFILLHLDERILSDNLVVAGSLCKAIL